MTREERRAYGRRYYAEHRDAILAYLREYRALMTDADRQRRKEYMRQYYRDNTERLKAERNRRYHEKKRPPTE